MRIDIVTLFPGMLGGPLSDLGGRYQGTPIGRLLPVSLPDAPPAGGIFRDVQVRPRLTAAGRAHPYSRDSPSRAATRRP